MSQQNITELLAIKDRISESKKKLEELYQAARNLQDMIKYLDTKLIDMCPHPTVRSYTKYSRGGYDYRSETRHFTECSICGNTQLIKIELGSFE